MSPLHEALTLLALLFQIGAHPVGRGVRDVEFRVLLLQIFQFAHQGIELEIRDDRSVFHVVTPVVFRKLFPEDAYSFLGFILFHINYKFNENGRFMK